MIRAMNTYIPDGDFAQDKAKRNSGGLSQSGTLIEQGDYPVNVADLVEHDKLDKEMRAEYPEMYTEDSSHIQPQHCAGDIEEGVSMCRPMFHDHIRKNSDY